MVDSSATRGLRSLIAFCTSSEILMIFPSKWKKGEKRNEEHLLDFSPSGGERGKKVHISVLSTFHLIFHIG